MNVSRAHQRGFTLLEILLVIAAISILAGIMIFAINPNKQLGQTRNAQRLADVHLLINAAYEYSIDNGGNLPSTIPTVTSGTCYDNNDTEVCAPDGDYCAVDLSVLTENKKYLVTIPVDPSGGMIYSGGSGYTIMKDADGRLVGCARFAELNETIQVTR